jgi:hypothetical protein
MADGHWSEPEDDMPVDSPTFVPPNDQDLLLTDVTEAELFGNVGDLLGVRYLSETLHFAPSPILKGIVFGQNKRLMINLLCKRKRTATRWIRVIFLVDTGSPYTYLAPNTIERLTGTTSNNICKTLHVLVNSETTCIECHLSPQDKHFKDVNVLGMEAMSKLGFSKFEINFQANEFHIFLPVS